ncbi:MAG: iron-sulfur cluster-binding domain-containing protein [Loktanella sp.]|nr:iron-sulfur cluster-binding domain-containing protein [Loktanella sp.]
MALDTQPTLRFWTDDEPLECVNYLPETAHTATFTFRPPSGALFRYNAGQFLTLALPVGNEPLFRTYTISSSPSRPTSLTVTVKAQPESLGSRWMLDNLRPGMRVKAIGPAGNFSNAVHPASKYLFISAGSGITPMMSMTTQMYDAGGDPDIVFINCARRPSEIIFRSRLEQMATRSRSLSLTWVVSEPDPFVPWTGIKGQMNQLILGLAAPDLTADPEDDVIPDEDASVQVTFARSGKTIKVAETETLLGAAKAAGVSLPSGCTFGVCGTCRVRTAGGQVHMVHNGGITEEDIADGYVLACCSNPIGDVSIDA